MATEVATREFEIGDYDAALKLWSRVEGVEIAEGDQPTDVAAFLKRNPKMSRVATADDKIVGVSLCGHDGRRGHIYHLAVDPEYRGRGIGRMLVDECLGHLREAGIVRAIVLVAQNNNAGREFWRRAGWEELCQAHAMGIDL